MVTLRRRGHGPSHATPHAVAATSRTIDPGMRAHPGVPLEDARRTRTCGWGSASCPRAGTVLAVVKQLAVAMPSDRVGHLRTELRWLQQVTGPTRDLDVHIVDLAAERARLPALTASYLERVASSCPVGTGAPTGGPVVVLAVLSI